MVPTNHRNLHQGIGTPRQAIQIRRDLHHHLEQRFGSAVSCYRLLGDQEGRSNLCAVRLSNILLHCHYLRHGCLI